MYSKDLKRRMQLGTTADHPSRPVKLACGPEEASDGREEEKQTGTWKPAEWSEVNLSTTI